MSIICALQQVTEAEIRDLLSRPERIYALLEASEAGEAPETDLDKAWHAIHFLLTGSAEDGDEPLCYLMMGGQQIGDEDVGYGPARALLPDEVKSFDAALSQVTGADLVQRFNPDQMMTQKIYPEIWDRSAEDPVLDYVVDYYEILRSFVREASDAGNGLIIYFC